MQDIRKLEAVSLPVGDFAPMWFDDDACAWNDRRLHRAGSLQEAWSTPQLHLYTPAKVATPVLFNPNAVAVSDAIRAALSAFDGIEFLPVQISEHGTYFIFRVVACIGILDGRDVHRGSNGAKPGNVVLVHSFPDGFRTEHPFFRLLQPADSPSGRHGGCVRATYMTAEGREAIESASSGLLYGGPLPAPWASRGV